NIPGNVYRYSAATGAFVDVFASVPGGTGTVGGNGLAFGPSGEFYVSEGGPTLQSGSYVARFAPPSFAAFTVSLSAPMASTVSVSFVTSEGSALASSDYYATSGTIDLSPGEM